jgi:hypothetical protein
VEAKSDANAVANLEQENIINLIPIQRMGELEEDIVKLNYKLIKSII